MNINYKKLLKIFIYVFFALFIILVLLELSLRFILPSESVKTKTLAYISQITGADIKTGDISASIFGITLNNISVDVADNKLFDSKKLHVGLNPFKVLIGQVYITEIILQEPSLTILRKPDGSFNFDPLITTTEEQEDNVKSGGISSPFDIRVKKLLINKAQIAFADLKENIKSNLQDLNFDLNKFSFHKTFDYELSFNAYLEQNNNVFINGDNFTLNAETNLNKLDLQGAVFNLKQLLINYKESSLKVQGQIDNFENPSGYITAELKDLSDKTLSDFRETISFTIPLITAELNFDYFTDSAKANIKNLTLKAGDTELNFKANIDLNKNSISEGKIKFISVLDALNNISPIIKEYDPKGQINADFYFAWPLALNGKLTLTDIGLFTDKAGTLEKLNTSVNVKSIDEIKIESFTGILNNNPFTMQASYSKQKEFADVLFDFNADKLYVFNTSKEIKTAEPQKQHEKNIIENDEKELENTVEENFHPININAKIDIKKLNVPFIKGDNLIFKANAVNLTPKMDKTHGVFDLSIQDGQIKDVYTISNANTITKIMFMSLGIVSKVVNTLNVLDLLNGMGKMLTGNKEEEEELPVHQEINGKMDFESFKTNIDFNRGFASMKRCAFVSSLFSFRVKGNINFDNRNINLNVESAPGKHTENGIMPLNIDIKGTIENPQGSLSVLSSVSELVGNSITNNPVSNMLKSTWGNLFTTSGEEEEKK